MRWRWRISTANRSMLPPRMARVVKYSAMPSRATTWVEATAGTSPSSAMTMPSSSKGRWA